MSKGLPPDDPGMIRSAKMQRVAGLAGCLRDADLDLLVELVRQFVILLSSDDRARALAVVQEMAKQSAKRVGEWGEPS